MVIAGRVAQAADAAAIGGIDAPDNIALLQHTTAEHFGFGAELVIVDVILGDKVVPSAAVAAAPAFSGKSLRIKAVGIRHPLSGFGDALSAAIGKAVGDDVPDKTGAVGTARCSNFILVAFISLPQVTPGGCSIEPCVIWRSQIVVGFGLCVQIGLPCFQRFTVFSAASLIDGFVQIGGAVQLCRRCLELCPGQNAGGQNHDRSTEHGETTF